MPASNANVVCFPSINCKHVPCQAFLDSCYSPDNLPLKSTPKIAANVASIARQVRVRINSKELRPVATPQQAPASSSSMATGMDQVMGMSCQFMKMMVEQAKALDAMKSQFLANDKGGLSKSSSGLSVGSADQSQEPTALLHGKVLPTALEPLPLLAPPAGEENKPDDPGQPQGLNKSNDKKSLEDYEMEAKEALSKRKAKEMDAVMKKPATKASSQGVTLNKNVTKKRKDYVDDKGHVAPAFLKGIYGCIRCRGNINGCSVRQSEHFGGQRFSSRDEYNKWYQKKQQTNNKRK